MKKGFTLIELLAVIVILAIIALIATPIVMNTIEKSKKNTAKINAQNYLSAVKITMGLLASERKTIPNGRYTIDENGNLVNSSGIYNVEVTGNVPNYGQVIINDKEIDSGTVLTINDYNVSYYIDQNTKIEEITTEKVKSDAIYGLQFDGNNYTRLNDAAQMNACVGTDTTTCVNDFDKAEIYKEMVEATDSYGNQFIKIPKFYIKKEIDGTTLRWFVSKKKYDNNYYLPACFYDESTNKELNYVLIGKYDASLDDNNKLESKTGTISLTLSPIENMRNYAKNNNTLNITGYQLMDIHVVDMLQTLFYIEFATLNSQNIMTGFTNAVYTNTHRPLINATSSNVVTLNKDYAKRYEVGQRIAITSTPSGGGEAKSRLILAINYDTGEITFDGNPFDIKTTYYVTNVPHTNGQTDSILTSSGSIINNKNSKYSMNYRGIENLYGNIAQFIDGINIKDNQIYVAKDAKKYNKMIYDEANGYYALNYVLPSYESGNSNKYIIKMGYDENFPFAQFPQEIGAYSNSKYQDYYQFNQNASDKIAVLSAGITNGFFDGLTYWNFNLSYSNFATGSRLVKTEV